MRIRNLFYVPLLSLLSLPLSAQQSDSLLQSSLDSVFVRATHLPTQALRLPYAIGQLNEADWGGGRQQLSMAEPLSQLPGLLVLNATNFAQDLRLSVRGFGARSAFGIRGLKILVDGLPQTTPDGQSQIDNLDGGMMTGAELLRGPASGLYGNAAGGIIRLETEAPPEEGMAEARFSTGSYGFRRYELKGGGATGDYRWLAYGSHTQSEGFREHSSMQRSLFNGRVQRKLGERGKLELLLNYLYSPTTEDPGGLTRELLETAPAEAWAANRRFNASETVQQGRAGLRWEQQLSGGQQLEVYSFYLVRDFGNFLPFERGGAVELLRQFAGMGARLRSEGELAGRLHRRLIGVSLQQQADRRRRFDNLEGLRGGKTLDQLESFRTAALYTVQEWEAMPKLWLTAALRYDFNLLAVGDDFLADGDDSGDIQYHNISPSLGLSYAWSGGQHIYANYSYSFEAPALSELSANPDGGGFNLRLQPQRAHNYELGAKGRAARWLRYDLALFYLQLSNELVPFEVDGQPGRLFFRNAGASQRQGVELALRAEPSGPFSGRLSYTLSDFRYQTYELPSASGPISFQGNRLPGIPQHLLAGQAAWAYAAEGLLSLEGRYLSAIFADDANANTAGAFFELNIRIAQQLQWKGVAWSFFGGLNNLLDTAYASNVRLNAFGGRFFEPAPGRNGYVGVGVAL